MHFGPAEVQIPRNDRQGLLRHMAELRLNGMKDRQQGTLHPLVGEENLLDALCGLDGIKHMAASGW
ncbi:hypothetical protein MASR2M74_23960 [Paracoccaceae bacterium]